MIARTWRGYATRENAPHYIEHFEQGVFPELQQIAGYQGAYVLQKERAEDVEILVMTFWESMEAIHQFAGDNAEVAVVAPAAQSILNSFDAVVSHYEVMIEK